MDERSGQPQPDDETRELLRVAKRVSRRTGMPVKVLMLGIARLVVAEQLRMEATDVSHGEPEQDG